MTEGQVIDVTRQALWIVLKVSAPLLLVSLIIGLAISIFQTVTSIQEQTLTFAPKLLAIFLVIILTGNWMMKNMVDFLVSLFTNFGTFLK